MEKLSNSEEVVLRLLYSGKKSKDIPTEFFGEQEKENLLSLDLIEIVEQGKYMLTEKAAEVLETGGFIVKYPLHNEKGVVMNFKDILNSYGKDAAKALGLSIINTEFYKKWGKFNNKRLLELLTDTEHFYRSFDHPLNRLESYKSDIETAKSNYDKVLYSEMSQIKPFVLSKPIIFTDSSSCSIIEYLGEGKGVVLLSGTKMEVDFTVGYNFRLTSSMMVSLIKQYYSMKSRPSEMGIEYSK